MNYLDIVVDCETYSLEHNAALLQIGAVKGDLMTGVVDSKFVVNIQVADCIDKGLHWSQGTVDWWNSDKVSDEARAMLHSPEPVPLVDGLREFHNWVGDWDKAQIWGNGPMADCNWIYNAYKACDRPEPWKYWNVRCVRTAVEMAERKFGQFKNDLPFDGVKHYGPDDALQEFRYLSGIFSNVLR